MEVIHYQVIVGMFALPCNVILLGVNCCVCKSLSCIIWEVGNRLDIKPDSCIFCYAIGNYLKI